MSRSWAEVFALDGKRLGHAVYEGSIDVLQPQVFSDSDAAWKVSRWEYALPPTSCEHRTQQCAVLVGYGGGFWWPSLYCSACGFVVGVTGPWAVLDTFDGSDRDFDEWIGKWPMSGEVVDFEKAQQFFARESQPPEPV